LGFIGLFGVIITLIEATCLQEWKQFSNLKPENVWTATWNYLGMAAVNFFTYSVIPFYVTRSGATLLNLSNVTTIVWSMLSDILLFGAEFYPLPLLAFAIEICGICLFSIRKP
jgi:drug/metabolite transporter (DMT)-like permease